MLSYAADWIRIDETSILGFLLEDDDMLSKSELAFLFPVILGLSLSPRFPNELPLPSDPVPGSVLTKDESG